MPRAQALYSSAILYPHAVAYENLACAAQTGADDPAIRAVVAQGNRFYAAVPLRMPWATTLGRCPWWGPRRAPLPCPRKKCWKPLPK